MPLPENDATRSTLLSRVRNPDDREAWRDFDARYGSLILAYCRKRGLQHWDAEDVRQSVMMSLSKSLRTFRYDRRRGHFRHYLGSSVRHAIAYLSKLKRNSIAAPDSNQLDVRHEWQDDELWDEEWMHHHLRVALNTASADFQPQTLHVFERLLEGASASEIACEFSMNVMAVHKIKQRVRDRLRSLVEQQILDEEFGV